MSSFKIINGSSVNQKVDAIVNAANRGLINGGGVCGAIFTKAGWKELSDACSKYKTPLNDGEVAITDSFNITNCKKIIHAVGPDFNRRDASIDDLFNAYYNSLLCLKNNNLHSISFPLISAGIFGGTLKDPIRVSTRKCIDAYNKLIKDYPEYEIDVLLCAYKLEEYNEALKEI
jgi:O-acetyl-ADP-ribose deacetylase (regulator of RNase III)